MPRWRAAARSGPLVATLEAWLGSGTSVAATARALGLHERTVRYRLARIEELATSTSTSADDRFRVELALRGRRLLRDGSEENPPL